LKYFNIVLEHEYGAKCRFEHRNIHKACWLHGDKSVLDDFMKFRQSNMALDKDGKPVFFGRNGLYLAKRVFQITQK
jgi:peptide chain release factor 3